MGILDDLCQIGADPPILSVSRDEILSGSVERLCGILGELSDKRLARAFRQKLWITVDGYDKDERELFEIPEVRNWFKALDARWPYCFFFLDPSQPANLLLFAASCCGIKSVRPDPSSGSLENHPHSATGPGFWWTDPNEVMDFMNTHFSMMNLVCDQLGDSEPVIMKMSECVMRVFESQACTGGG